MSRSRPPLTILARAVYPLHPPGGMERAVYEQLRHLAARGWPLRLITQSPTQVNQPIAGQTRLRLLDRSSSPADNPSSPVDHSSLPTDNPTLPADYRLQPDNPTITSLPYSLLPIRRNSIPDRLLNYPLFVARVARRLQSEPTLQGALIHAHGLLAAAAPGSVPLVYAPHGLEEFSRADWRKWLAYAPIRSILRRAARGAAAILATDTSLRPAVIQTLQVPSNRVHVIPNGVSVASLDALVDPARQRLLARRLGYDRSSLRLVSCARLERNKGLHLALTALAAIHADLPADWGWWIVGRGQEETALRQQAVALGLADHLHLVGALNDQELHNLLPAMDLYLTPSLYEGSSIATLEAMSHRLPVVATAVGGLPDKVLPDQTGLLVAAGSAAALAAGLRRTLANRSNWPTQGQAGRRLVEQRFDWPAIARQLDDLYTSLLDQTRPGD